MTQSPWPPAEPEPGNPGWPSQSLPTMADLSALAAELDEIDAALARMDAGPNPEPPPVDGPPQSDVAQIG